MSEIAGGGSRRVDARSVGEGCRRAALFLFSGRRGERSRGRGGWKKEAGRGGLPAGVCM